MMIVAMSGYVNAHQWTPTYPELTPSYVEGILEAKMVLFNKREEVEYYEIDVFDAEWNPIPFASQSKLVQIRYLETKAVSVFIRKQDQKRAMYICTRSRLKKDDVKSTVISSRICSKIK